MNMHRVRTIINKEWEEVFKNKMVVFTVAAMPILFTILPLAIIFGMSSTMTGDALNSGGADIPAQFLNTCGDIPAGECFQIFMMNQFMIMFMMLPLIIPTAIAAYSIVGEKTTRSLEPLLATPVTTAELLTGKALAAAVPAIGFSWLSFGLFLLLLPLAGGTPALLKHVTGPVWMLAIGLIGPLLAIASVNLAVIVSSRVNDPRAAEQISSVLIVPLLALFFGQIAGLIVLNMVVIGFSILAMLALDVALVYAGTRLFQRETILTRWK